MRNKPLLIVLVVLALLLILALPRLFLLWSGPSGNGAGNASQAPGVIGYIVQPQPLSHMIQASGTLLPDEEVALTSEASGRVTGIHFKEGSYVGKGQLLVQLNDADWQAQRGKLKQQIKLARKTEARQKQLLEAEAVSESDYEEALNKLETLEAELAEVKAAIEKTEIRAPFNGTIGLREVSPGAYVNAGQTVAQLLRIQPVKVEFSVPERYAAMIRPGHKVYFTGSQSKDTHEATVYAIEPRIARNTRAIRLRATTPNPGRTLYPGGYVDLRIPVQQDSATLLVPTEALIPELKGQKVFVYKNGRVHAQQVETGIRLSESVQIIRGLAPGDTIITSGILLVRPGGAVRLKEVKMEQ